MLLVAGAVGGPIPLAAAVVLVQLAVASAWHDLLRAPGARAGSLVGLATGIAGTVAMAGGPSHRVGWLAVVATAGVFGAFIQQLVSGAEGLERLAGMSATTALVVVEVLAPCWQVVGRGSLGPWVVATGVAGALAATLLVAAAGTSTWSVSVAVLVGAGLGALLGWMGPERLDPYAGGAIAAAAALAATSGAQVRRVAGRSARRAPATVGALPLAVAGPAVLVAVRVVLG